MANVTHSSQNVIYFRSLVVLNCRQDAAPSRGIMLKVKFMSGRILFDANSVFDLAEILRDFVSINQYPKFFGW